MKITINIPDTDITAKGLTAIVRRINPQQKFESEGEKLITEILEYICDMAFEAADPVAIEAKKELRRQQQQLQSEAKARREALKNK